MNSTVTSALFKQKNLHPLIYIIADKPTKNNISKYVPLVGTDSYKTLLEWIAEMDIDITRIRMYNQIDDPFGNTMSRATLNQATALSQIRVIALGQKAATYLKKTGIINYFILPHPSGLNRVLNSRKFLKDRLAICKRFVYEGINEEEKDTKTVLPIGTNTAKQSYKEQEDLLPEAD